MNEESRRTGQAKDKMSSCHRFFETLGPHWADAVDQNYLLQRLSSGAAQGQSGSGSPVINLLLDVIMSNPPADAGDNGDDIFISVSGKVHQQEDCVENDPRSTNTLDDDDFSNYLVEEETHSSLTSQQHAKLPLLLSPLSPVSGNEQRPVPSEGKYDDDEIKHAFYRLAPV